MTGTTVAALRVELNRLHRALVRELDQVRCDELEGRIQALEQALAQGDQSKTKRSAVRPTV